MVKMLQPKEEHMKIEAEEHKKIAQSETRAKKEKAKINVKDAANALLLRLKDGDVVIEMFADDAPEHVKRIKELVRQGFYDGLKFHRVIDGFMAQTGCPLGTGTGGSGHKLKAEFNRRPHNRGTLSMARAMDPNSADSQFFICLAESAWLNGQYTVWGEVVSGMEAVDAIKKGGGQNGMVDKPDTIIKISVVEDL